MLFPNDLRIPLYHSNQTRHPFSSCRPTIYYLPDLLVPNIALKSFLRIIRLLVTLIFISSSFYIHRSFLAFFHLLFFIWAFWAKYMNIKGTNHDVAKFRIHTRDYAFTLKTCDVQPAGIH